MPFFDHYWPPRWLGAGLAAIAAVLLPLRYLVDGIDEPALYVGPSASYYEFTTVASEARRETDESWRAGRGTHEQENTRALSGIDVVESLGR